MKDIETEKLMIKIHKRRCIYSFLYWLSMAILGLLTVLSFQYFVL